MDTFMGRYRNISILAAAIFFQVVGLAIQIKRHNAEDSTRLIRVWTVGAIAPFEKAIVRLQSGSSGIWHNYFYLRGVRQENRGLQQQIQQMQLEQVRLRQDAEQARRLQTLLGFKEQFINKTVAAQVIGSSGSEQSRLVYIDKGSDDGIKTDMAVMTASGVVGKVSNVINGSTSQVLLINDQNSGVGTILEQSRLQGVLKGKASGELALDKVMAEEEVKPGDRVLTSGGDLIFPKGLPVGTVDKINRGPEFLQVIVRPAASLNHLEEVLVITQKLDRPPALASGTQVRAADILAQRLPSVPDTPPNGQGAVTETEGAVVPKTSVKPQNEVAKPQNEAARNSVVVPVAPNTNPNTIRTSAGQPAAQSASRSNPIGTSAANSAAQPATHLVPTAVGIKPAQSGALPTTAQQKSATGTAPATVPKSTSSAISKPAKTSPLNTTAAPKTTAPDPTIVPAKAAPVKPSTTPASKPASTPVSKPASPPVAKPPATTTSSQPNSAGDTSR